MQEFKKALEITGMSCGGCVNSVKQALMKNVNIADVEFQLNPPAAVITSTRSKNIDLSHLQALLYLIKGFG